MVSMLVDDLLKSNPNLGYFKTNFCNHCIRINGLDFREIGEKEVL